jgi:hypothetical protein
MGRHGGPVTVAVQTAWPCGHTQGGAVATCHAHLDHLLAQGGTAEEVVACPVCGVVAAASVSETFDLQR